MTREEELQRGAQAQSLLNDPIIRDALAAIKTQVIDQWAACPARDTEGREWLWRHYQVALKFEEALQEVINTGKLARAMEREQSVTDKIRKAVGF